MNELEKVAVVGLGYVGQPTVAAFLKCGYNVVGIDTDPARVLGLQTGNGLVHEPGLAEAFASGRGRLVVSSDYSLLRTVQAVVVTVGTPLGTNGEANLSFIESMASSLAPHLAKGQLILLRSTVAPGTTRRIGSVLERLSGLEAGPDFSLAFSPERTIEGIAMEELFRLPSIIGGIDERSVRLTEELLTPLGTPLIPVDSPETAELCKLADNSYRAVNIALANELGAICEAAGVDAYELVRAVGHAYPRTNLFRPGLGADGPCLSKDPSILASYGLSVGIAPRLLQSSVEVNKAATGRVTVEIVEFLRAHPELEVCIAMLGLAFKGFPETDDTRNSPAVQVLDGLDAIAAGISGIKCYDPVVTKVGVRDVSRSIEKTISGANIVLLLNDHATLRDMSLSRLLKACGSPLLVVDPWHSIVIDVPVPAHVTLRQFGRGR